MTHPSAESVLRRAARGLGACAPASCLLPALAAFFLAGCVGPGDLEAIMDRHAVAIEEPDLSEVALARRIAEIDEAYSEPRTPKKVEYSYETARMSISSRNNFESLWRAVRACAWLGLNHTDQGARKKYAELGLALGREATRRLSNRVEPYYYLALSRGGYCELENCTPAVVRKMRDDMRMALAIDRTFDHCGPYRFLGKVMVETEAYPNYALGSLKEGIELLSQAVALCPDFGENNLFLAEALIENEQYVEAYEQLQVVLQSTPPADHSAEHGKWLARAEELMRALPIEDLVDTVEDESPLPPAPEKTSADLEGAAPAPASAGLTSGER